MSGLNDKLLEIKRQKDTYILPENIKKDVTVYGVTGTLEAGSSGGDVKLFDTIEHMQEDENPQDGDLAVVYRKELTAVTADSEFSSCTFPNTVILPTAYSNDFWGMFRTVDESSGYFNGNVQLSASRFRFNGYGDGAEIRVEYESQDGITYTRTDGGEELQDFGVAIKYEQMGEWDDTLGYFMKIGGNYFEGMYEYKENFTNTNKRIMPLVTNFDVDFENRTASYDFTQPQMTIDNEKIINLAAKIADDNSLSEVYSLLCVDSNNVLHILKGVGQEGGASLLYSIDKSKQYPESGTSISAGNGSYISNMGDTWECDDYILNSSLTGYTKSVKTFIKVMYGNTTTYYCPTLPLKTAPWKIILRPSTGSSYKNSMDNRCVVGIDKLITSSTNEVVTSFTTDDIWLVENTYMLTSTQLNTTADYVYEKTFYGKNGVESGILTTNVSNSFVDTNAELVYKIQQQYENMTPRILTDSNKAIDKNIYFIPIKKDDTPLLDTSSVTNMASMFSNCINLTTIPQLDTSNVTTMAYTFSGCTNLVKISLLNTSNVTNMNYMFSSCKNLIIIPQLNTSNVTTMYSMFDGCLSLTEIPQLNTSNVTTMEDMFRNCKTLMTIPLLDTSSVTNMASMFSNCINLTTIPQLDTSNVTTMYEMFIECASLTTIPQLNTGNVTSMQYMFKNCTNLTAIPQLNTSKVTGTGMYNMFYNCTSLTTIPQLDTSNMTSMYEMFTNCPSLSNESLNNILAMCTNATKVTSANKKLKSIGLSETQANVCKTLSNYSAFTNAGWTTGY